MTEQQSPGPGAPGMNLGDILYIVFRHKWKIVMISTISLAAALSLRWFIPREYESEAKLYVRYVLESEAPTQSGANDTRIKTPGGGADTLMNTEVQILNNRDLAQRVATVVGVEKILGGKTQGAEDANKAAVALLKGLTVEVPKDTSVLHLTYKHTNPDIVQAVLQQLIDEYLKKHLEIHAVGALDEAFSRESDERRNRLERTREELKEVKEKVAVTSLEDAKKSYNDELSRAKQELHDAEVEVAEREATVAELRRAQPAGLRAGTNELSGTNAVAAPAEAVAEYQRTMGLLDALTKREAELLVTFTQSNSMVRDVQAQIAANESRKSELERKHPELLTVKTPAAAGAPGPAVPGQAGDLAAELVRLTAAQSRVVVLKQSLEQVKQEVKSLIEAESKISELQTRQELEEAQYKRFAEKQDQSKTEERLGAGRVSNISPIQPPSPPLKALSKLRKMMAMVFLGGVGGAIGLAFLIELYLDPSVRRPQDLNRLKLPVFMSIPMLNGKMHAASLAGAITRMLTEGTAREAAAAEPGQPAPWDPRHGLRPFAEALRDRLMNYFDKNNMTHKPKLVAVTSCGEGSGVSTIAAGLAASLSETGEGNVLLVDMNLENGGAAHFHKGDLACGIDEALQVNKREQALVQDKLYMVTETGNREKLPAALPKRLKNLVPRLKASDYDYIIFDMPPVSQVSMTPRLSRFMDITLMVAESETTSREVLQKAASLLEQAQANVGVVLNKTREYVPRKLQQDL